MGEGPNKDKTPAVSSKRSPRDEWEESPGAAQAGGGAASAVAEVHPCAAPRTVPFRAAGSVSVGSVVDVSGGSPPEVRLGAARIGVVTGQEANAVESCLRLGYRFSGRIESFDVATLTGTLAITGRN